MHLAADLPEIVSPTLFFEKLLVEWSADMFDPPAPIEDVCLTIQIELTGEGGGTWSCTFDLGDYRVEHGPATTPTLTLRSTMDAWNHTVGRWIKEHAIEMEEAGGPEAYIQSLLDQEAQGHKGIPKLTDAMLDKLKAQPTVFATALTNETGPVHGITVGLYTQDLSATPRFTIQTDRVPMEQMRARTLHPFEAWKSKQIQIIGELAHALKLGRILL